MARSRGKNGKIEQSWRHAREPVFWLDGDLVLVAANAAWEQLTGQSIAQAVGLECKPHGPTADGGVEGLAGSLFPPEEARRGLSARTRTLIRRPDGSQVACVIDFTPLRTSSGPRLVLMGVIRAEPEVTTPSISDDGPESLRTALLTVRERLWARYGHDALIGRGARHERLLAQVRTAAQSSSPTLVVGEPGSGRRTVARAIHALSKPPAAPFLVFDPAAIPAESLAHTLFESSEASDSLRVPDDATLVLGDLPAWPRDLQARLARRLASDSTGVERPGIRVVALAGADVEAAVRDDRLSNDLYYTISALVIPLAPLRDRRDEIPLLAQHFLERVNLHGDRQRIGFDPEAMNILNAYDWPGNLAELARVIAVAHAARDDEWINASDLPAAIQGHWAGSYSPPAANAPTAPLDELLTQVERALIERALTRAKHNKSRAADILGVSRPRLYRRIKELELPDLEENTPAEP